MPANQPLRTEPLRVIDPLGILKIALIVVAAWVTIVWLSGALYVAVSYAVAIGQLPPRPLSHTLRSVLLESWNVLWSQPLMPWFQLFGKRMLTGGGTVPVVMLHGYFQNRVDFLYLASRMIRRGSGPLYACNFFWPQSLDTSAENVLAFVEKVLSQTGAEQVDLLTHSSGGLLALDIIDAHPELIRRAAFIALPAHGVQWRGPILGTSGEQLRSDSHYYANRRADTRGVPALSIYSAHDNVVYPVETSILEGPNVVNEEVQGLGHLAILFDNHVANTVCDFLLAE
jgi:triacylglycerol lipase